MDEATPHLHIDYIPVAHVPKGLQVRNSLDESQQEQGIDGKATREKTALPRWQEKKKRLT